MAKLSSGAEIRKLFVSSDLKYRLPGGIYSEFTKEVQGDIISCGNPCYFCIADLCLPNSIYNEGVERGPKRKLKEALTSAPLFCSPPAPPSRESSVSSADLK